MSRQVYLLPIWRPEDQPNKIMNSSPPFYGMGGEIFQDQVGMWAHGDRYEELEKLGVLDRLWRRPGSSTRRSPDSHFET